MHDMKTIAVFLGSSEGKGEKWRSAARDFGAGVAKAGIKVVYGGADVGTMKALADGVQQEGGQIVGVFPTGFEGRPAIEAENREIARKGLTEMIFVKDFDERKATMMRLSEAAVVLPGSCGTMDEAFSYAVNAEIGIHSKPVCVLDFDGYYRGLRLQIQTMVQNGYMTEDELEKMFRFFDTQAELLEFLKH